MSDLFEFKGAAGAGYAQPLPLLDEESARECIPEGMRRKALPRWPKASEPELVRHYTWLSTRNFGIDTGFYPLGSCTMKHNPRLNERIVQLPGMNDIHPLAPESHLQGLMAIYFEMQEMLAHCSGMDQVTLQPVAGAQGEFTAIRCIQEYHRSLGESERTEVIVPDSAHGTNPASVVMAGFDVIQVKSDQRGRVDLDDLREKLSTEVAGMMLTQPNTLGLFEEHISEITGLIHEAGGLMYMDGANLNALLGLVNPADMGFDIVHINLHKTFSTPHGGGGPGAGPIGVTSELAKFLPLPLVIEKDGKYSLHRDLPDSVGRVHAFFGNFGILVRAYTYIRMLGLDGIQAISRLAILNANYLMSKLTDAYEVAFDGPCMHEFVLSASRQKKRGVRALDIGKRLLDFGFHAPTIYFPLNVPEALMTEPTDSETMESLDRFAEAMLKIDEESKSDPEKVRNAPYSTPVRRLDETAANRTPDLRWIPE